jgi:hypothetical protein
MTRTALARVNAFQSAQTHAFWVLLAAIVLVTLILTSQPRAEAKDLTNRLGVGYINQLSADMPSLAVKYYPTKELGLTGGLGIDTQSGGSRFGVLAKVHRIIFPEDRMNFYIGAGAGLVSSESSGRTESGFELQGYAGTEVFLPGLDNFGASVEFGVAVTSVSSGVRFRTIGDSPVRAGMVFYF